VSERKNRVKIVFLDPRFAVTVLNWHIAPMACLQLQENSGLPDDCEVLSVYADHSRRAIGCLVCHDSFDLVPEGEHPPYHPGLASVEYKVHLKSDIEGYRENMRLAINPKTEQQGLFSGEANLPDGWRWF